jgi:hypothetical protein
MPSAGRTLPSAPFAYVLVASGLCWLVSWMTRGVWVPRAVTAIVLLSILFANSHRYFVTYADGLPNHNVPFGRIIADYLHELPDQRIHAFIIDCCWGENGQPEPKGIQYLGAGPVATSMTVLTSDLLDCDAMAKLPRPAVLIWTPADEVPVGLEPCAGQLTPLLHTSDGQQIFSSSEL